jgi:predicted transcriptional regulator
LTPAKQNTGPRETMEDNDAPGKANLNQVAEIISSYVRHTTVAAADLPRVIADVYRALAGSGQAAELSEPRRPAVPIRHSIAPEFVVCLECGLRARTLHRHLRAAHGLSPDEYRARWGLAGDHPLVAPGYSARRSAIAKAGGFGQRRGA